MYIKKFVEDSYEDHLLSELDNVSIKDCLRYTSYGFFIGAIISLLQGDIEYAIIPLLIAIFLKL